MTQPAHDRLLDVGQQLFSTQGYAATSMRQVAETAGLSLGNIYNHFPSKEGIFQSILLERNPFARRNLRRLPETINRQQAAILLDELTLQPDFFNLILIELLEFKGNHLPGLFEKIFDAAPPASWHTLLSLLISYHVTHILLTKALPSGPQASIPPDVLLDCFLNGILTME